MGFDQYHEPPEELPAEIFHGWPAPLPGGELRLVVATPEAAAPLSS